MHSVVRRKIDGLDRPALPVRQFLLLEAREEARDLAAMSSRVCVVLDPGPERGASEMTSFSIDRQVDETRFIALLLEGI